MRFLSFFKLSLWILFAILIQRHRCRRRDIVAIRQTPDGNFHNIVKQQENVVREAATLVTDDKRSATVELVLVQIPGIGRLLEADKSEAVVAELLKYRRQRAMNFEPHGLGAVASDLALELGCAGADHSR
jgi:hypothetical protein